MRYEVHVPALHATLGQDTARFCHDAHPPILCSRASSPEPDDPAYITAGLYSELGTHLSYAYVQAFIDVHFPVMLVLFSVPVILVLLSSDLCFDRILRQGLPSSGVPSGGFRLVAIDEDRPLLVHLKVNFVPTCSSNHA